MQPQFFCTAHAVIMQTSEEEALKYWTMTMHRGIAAYGQCRMDAAKINFGAALEIAALRLAVAENVVFSSLQLLKPLEFLCEVDIVEERYEEAKNRVLHVMAMIEQHDAALSQKDEAVLKRLQQSLDAYALAAPSSQTQSVSQVNSAAPANVVALRQGNNAVVLH